MRLEATRSPTRITFADGALIQTRTHPEPTLELRLLDFAAEEDAEAQAEREAEAEAVRPFDLTRGPLLRATLIALAAEDHLLLLTMHHIISTAGRWVSWCASWRALYAANGEAEAPLPLAVQYGDFAAWQRAHLVGARLEEELAAWRARLSPLPPRCRSRPIIRARRCRPSADRCRASRCRPAADALRALARAEGRRSSWRWSRGGRRSSRASRTRAMSRSAPAWPIARAPRSSP
ncbi:MAG: condensation domain-containing protein [Candidatus Eisenbacteria bacterium]